MGFVLAACFVDLLALPALVGLLAMITQRKDFALSGAALFPIAVALAAVAVVGGPLPGVLVWWVLGLAGTLSVTGDRSGLAATTWAGVALLVVGLGAARWGSALGGEWLESDARQLAQYRARLIDGRRESDPSSPQPPSPLEGRRGR